MIPSDPLIKRSAVHWRGTGQDGTHLILVDGADTNFIVAENFATNTGTRTSTGTCNDWSIRDMTIDGNGFNQTGTSSALLMYGAGYRLENVVIRQGRTYNFWAEYDDTPAFHSSGWTTGVSNCHFIQSGSHNVVLDGPTDSFWSNSEVFIANDPSYSLTDAPTYLLWVKAGGSSTVFSACHFTANYINTCVRLDASAIFDASCQIEGGATQQVYLANGAARSIIKGRVFYFTTGQATKGVVLGNGTTDWPARAVVDILTNNLESGSVDFTGDGGNSDIRVVGDQATGTTGWVGTPGFGSNARISILAGSTKLALNKTNGRRLMDAGTTADTPIVIASSASLALDQECVFVAPTGNVTGVTLPAAAELASASYQVWNRSAFTVTVAAAEFTDGVARVIPAGGCLLLTYNFGWMGVVLATS
jgi:hypothetical protein